MKQNDREDLILDVISKALEKKVNRGCSYSYVGLDSYVNKTKVKDALNEKFALSLNESSLNFNNIGQLVDFIKPQIGWDVFHSYSDATDQILDVVSLVAGMKVIRGNSFGFAGLDNPSSKTKLKNALNNTFNLSLTESSLDQVPAASLLKSEVHDSLSLLMSHHADNFYKDHRRKLSEQMPNPPI